MRVVLDGQITGRDGIGRLTRQLAELFRRIGAEEGLHVNVEPADDTPRYSVAEGDRLLAAITRERADLLHVLDYRVPLASVPVPIVANIHDVLRLYHPEFCYSDEEFTTRFGAERMALLKQLTCRLRPLSSWPAGAIRSPASWHEEFYGRMVAHTAVTAAALVTPTRTVADQLAETLGGDTVATVACYGVNHLPAAGRLPLAAASRLRPGGYVLYVGQARRHKGLTDVLEAFRISRAVRRGLRLALVGRDFAEEDASFGEDTVVLGEVDDVYLSSLYANAAALIHLARHEGFGFTPLEALSRGTAVLASDLPVLRETLGSYARFTDPSDPRATARELERLLDDDATSAVRRDRMIWAARYAWEDCARKVIRCYREVLR